MQTFWSGSFHRARRRCGELPRVNVARMSRSGLGPARATSCSSPPAMCCSLGARSPVPSATLASPNGCGGTTWGLTWEYMYAVDELRGLSIPYRDMNRIVGYAAANVVQGFTVLDHAKSDTLMEAFGLASDAQPAAPSQQDCERHSRLWTGATSTAKPHSLAASNRRFCAKPSSCDRRSFRRGRQSSRPTIVSDVEHRVAPHHRDLMTKSWQPGR
jgi:hypothetical protein